MRYGFFGFLACVNASARISSVERRVALVEWIVILRKLLIVAWVFADLSSLFLFHFILRFVVDVRGIGGSVLVDLLGKFSFM